ncbi:unnamed protein product [Euphydryas editha]|uniref:Uncharacterized protein n=1 Tax=Euphydryas editha TaxID=104508 RepID=A0AAU9UMN1_EUPED|nr:unnamed protein product [Euphydryas editha]
MNRLEIDYETLSRHFFRFVFHWVFAFELNQDTKLRTHAKEKPSRSAAVKDQSSTSSGRTTEGSPSPYATTMATLIGVSTA